MTSQNTKTKSLLLLLILINFLIIFASGFIMPVWAEFVKNIHGDLRTAGNAICLFSVILGLFTWIAAKVENHLNRNQLILIISQALFILSYASYLWVEHPWQLYIVQICLGLSGAIQAPALFALYESVIPNQQTTFYWGIWAGSYNVAMGISALIGAYTVHHFGFRSMFELMLATATVCFIFTIVASRNSALLKNHMA